MSALNKTQNYQEPTRDEIAMSAFLAWEKDGRPADREMHYWLAAEGQLRAARLKKVEAATAAALKAAARTTLPKSAKLAPAVKRETTVNVVSAPKSAPARVTAAPPVKSGARAVRRSSASSSR